MLSNAYSYKTNMERLEALYEFSHQMVVKLPKELRDKFDTSYNYIIGDITQKCSVSRSLSPRRNLSSFKQPELDFNQTLLAYFQDNHNTLFGCFDIKLFPGRFALIEEIILKLYAKDGDSCYKPNQIDIAINNHIYDYALYSLIIEYLNLFDFHTGTDKYSYFGGFYLEVLKLRVQSINKLNSLALFSTNKININRIKLINLFENFLYFKQGECFEFISDTVSMSYKLHLRHEHNSSLNSYYDKAMKTQFEEYRKLFDTDQYRDACLGV